MTDLRDYLPQPTTWFSETLTYQGIAHIEFSQPIGWVEGMMIFEVNHIGIMTVVLEIDRWMNSETPNDTTSIISQDWLLAGHRGNTSMIQDVYIPPQSTDNKIISMSLQAMNGGHLTSENIPYYDWSRSDNIATMKLYVDKALYFNNGQSKIDAKYWIIPCINLYLPHPFGITQAHRYTNLRKHPLRIFPVSDKTDEFLASDASEKDKNWVQHYLTGMSYIVGFFYKNKPAYIEQLPNYSEITQKLKEGVLRLAVTSIMVGEFSSEAEEILPLDLLPVLSLATGRPVGASWIEFHDQDANLIYRIHGNLGHESYADGRSIINDTIHSGGLGKLLTEATNSTILSNPEIRGTLYNAAKAMSGRDTITIFYNTCTALDELFAYYKIEQKIHPLKSFLNSSQIKNIENILNAAKDAIKLLKAQVADPNTLDGKKQIETIDKVANKTRSQPLEQRKNFGDKLVALVEHLGLSDIEVLKIYYPTIETWIEKIDVYRNNTMHATYNHDGDVFDPQRRQNLEQIVPHLIDILVRVMLKTIGYSGKYAPFVSTPNSIEELDWVTPATPPSYLRYK